MCDNVFTENTGSDSVINDFNGNQTRHQSLSAPFTLRFVKENGEIKVYINDMLQSTMTDNTSRFNGFYIKLYQTRQVIFKNLKITGL